VRKISDGRIIIDTQVDSSGAENGAKSLGAKLSNIASTGIKAFTVGLGAITAAATGVGVKCIELASNLSEVQNVVDTTFGDNASKINEWAQAADTSFGMSELSAKQMTGTLGAMLKSMGLTGDEVLNMSENMTGLSGDFASFYNLKPEEAFEKIRSGISGETEPLKQLGINMSVANLQAYALAQGLTKPYDKMTQSEQAMLRYNYLMSVSKDAQGDFAKTSGSLANQLRIAQLNVQSLGADIGNLLLPVAQDAMQSFNGVAEQLRTAFQSEEVKAGITSIAESISGLIQSIVELVVNNLPSIINGFSWILENSSTISAGIVGIGVAMKAFSVAMAINTLITAYTKAVEAAALANETLTVSQWLLTAAQKASPIGIVVSLIAGLVAAIVVLWNTNEGFRNAIIGAWTAIGTLASTVWGGIVTFFTTTIPEAINSMGTFFTSTVPQFFSDLWTTITTACQNGWNSIVIFFTESIPAWLDSVGAWFMELPNKIAYGLGAALGSIMSWGANTWSYLTTNVPLWIEGIGTFFSELPGKIQTWLTNVITNITAWGSSMLTEASTWASNTITGIVNFFTQLPGQILTYLSQCVTNITTWGSNMLSEATTGMTNVFNGIVDTFTNLPSKMLEIGTNIVAGIKQGIKDEWYNMTGWIGGLCKSFTQGVKDNFVIKSPSHIFRDEIGRMLVKGMQVGTELEFPNLQDSMGSNISDLTAQLQASVDYNMAKTTANISASANRAAGISNTSNSTTTNNNAPLFSVEHFHNDNNTSIEQISQELAFLGKRNPIR